LKNFNFIYINRDLKGPQLKYMDHNLDEKDMTVKSQTQKLIPLAWLMCISCTTVALAISLEVMLSLVRNVFM